MEQFNLKCRSLTDHPSSMKIAVEGCCHGELDKIYETLEYLEKKNNIKIDLLLICGDFQAVRNFSDMKAMAVPPKHMKLQTFHKYYSGEKKAPIPTVFIGGNHEASNYLLELPYGGWVAPNIYYMGYAGVIQFGGVRIAGLSGIFKGKDYQKGHFECPPYKEDTKRSAYHVRNFEVFRLKQLKRPVDIFLSHDWPRGIHKFGDVNALLRKKKFFQEDIENNRLGSPPAMELLLQHKPQYWFSAHLHVKFPALLLHEDGEKTTKFLSLDKCLPRRHFLQVLDIPHDSSKPMKICLDPEWLMILKSTNHLLNLSSYFNYLPGPGSPDRWDFSVTEEEIEQIKEDFGGDLTYPENFEKTSPAHDSSANLKKAPVPKSTLINPQTTLVCSMLDITDPNAVFLGKVNLPDNYCLSLRKGGSQDDDEDVDDGIDDDYESEVSFISQTDSERSFSDRSFSFLSTTGNDSFASSTGNESYYSLGNPDEISIDDNGSKARQSGSKISEDENLVESLDPNEISVSDDDEEYQSILAEQKKTKDKGVEGKSKLDQSGCVSISDDEDDEFVSILAAQKKEQSSVEILSTSSSDLDILSEGKSEKSAATGSSMSCLSDSKSIDDVELVSEGDHSDKKNLSLSDSLSDVKSVEFSDDDRDDGKKKSVKIESNKSSGNKMIEMSMDDDDIEFQEILASQKQSQAIGELQKDLGNLKPKFQSSPAVSLEDRAMQSLLSKEVSPVVDKGFQKRPEVENREKMSPMTKKFKRRNLELYSDASTEEET